MMNFENYLVESKNTHMEHIEDLIFNDGVNGARNAINFLRDLRDMLSGHVGSKHNITVKWDGAPAIFAGIDPTDGNFFVAKKGIFNKNPKLYKSYDDIDKDLSGDLNKKFKIALTEFKKLGIKKGVYQGDLMYTHSDIEKITIEGEKYYSFQPNTIVYTVPVNSRLAREIIRARIGVVWHTTYTGKSLESLSASFGEDITKKFKSIPSIWQVDATYHDVSGKANFTAKETAQLTRILSTAGKTFQGISGDSLRAIEADDELKMRIKTFNNTFVRAGKPFPNPNRHVTKLFHYIHDYYQKEIDKKKTTASKKKWEDKRSQIINKLFHNKSDLVQIFHLMNIIIQAKQMVINKLNEANSLGTFLRVSNGYKVTRQEGFVAIDSINGAVKLVDRLEFSRANFSPDVLKGWEK